MKASITRRGLLLGGAALAITPRLTQAAASQTTGTTSASNALSNSNPEVQVIPFSNSAFAALLAERFQGLQYDPTFRTLSRLAAIVHHRKGPSLVAQNVEWSLSTETDVVDFRLAKFVKPSTKFSTITKTPTVSAERDILKPEECLLITPFFALRQANFKGTSDINWNMLIRRGPLQQFIAHEMPSVKQVNASLDCAIFSDATFVGPDKGKLPLNLQAKKNAEIHVSASVLKQMNAGQSDSDIKHSLHENATAERFFSQDRQQLVFERSRKMHATVLLKLYNAAGRERVYRAVSQLANRPDVSFSPAQA